MSFDLKIENGDLKIGADGDLAKVENTEKLIQDILKIALTPLSTGNPFFPFYGSPVAKTLIGNVYDFNMMEMLASDQLRTSLETLQTLQKIQAKGQRVTAAETLAALQEVRVEKNQTDPRYFKVIIKALTKALTTANTSFNVTL